MLQECIFVSIFAHQGQKHLSVDRSVAYIMAALISNFNSFRLTVIYMPLTVLVMNYFVATFNYEQDLENGVVNPVSVS